MKRLVIIELVLLISLFLSRFFLATFNSISYHQTSFYRNYEMRLKKANADLEFKINKKLSLENLSNWAVANNFKGLKEYRIYEGLQVVAQK